MDAHSEMRHMKQITNPIAVQAHSPSLVAVSRLLFIASRTAFEIGHLFREIGSNAMAMAECMEPWITDFPAN